MTEIAKLKAYIKDGPYESFHENGQLEWRGNCKDGELDGLQELFHENGQLSWKANYKDGIQEGRFEEFYENGELKCRGSLKDNKLDGPVEEFKENGQPEEKENYKDGIQEGLQEYFYDNGQLKWRGNWKDEKEEGLWKRFYDNGQLFRRESYKDGIRDGLWECFNRNGQLFEKESYKDGVLQDEEELARLYKEQAAETEAEAAVEKEKAEKRATAEAEAAVEAAVEKEKAEKRATAEALLERLTIVRQLPQEAEAAVEAAAEKENYKDGVLQDAGDGQTADTGTVTTDAAPKGKNSPVAAELTEKITVTLSRNHKTFKTESGDYRLERYKDNKIRAFKDDEVCSNTKNVLRAINEEYKLEFTSVDFKKMHTTKLGKEIIEQIYKEQAEADAYITSQAQKIATEEAKRKEEKEAAKAPEEKENYKDGVLQDAGDGQTADTGTVTTDAAPKGKNSPVAAELTEKITVTLSRNHKTFKTESGDYRLERYKDNKIRAFKDDEVCSNTKNVLRAINEEYKLEFTSVDFKKMHTTKLGKEIIEQMKTRK